MSSESTETPRLVPVMNDELAHEKHVADVQEALDTEFGK
jgi:hypothetical protein